MRRFEDFDLAEEVLQDALLRAWERWPVAGVPDNAAAWLFATARHRAIDLLRVRNNRRRLLATMEVAAPEPPRELSDFDDDLLGLLFGCCHPALALPAQIALTLHAVADLEVGEVARAFLVAPRTMEQRLTRAKRKIRDAGIPLEVPAERELFPRLDGVLQVVYLIFTEGHAATHGDVLVRRDLCGIAIQLARELVLLVPGRAEPVALLSLLVLQDARAAARVDEQGALVLLADQDRSRWDRSRIEEGLFLIDAALRLRQPPGQFQLEAAIAALHARAPFAKDTDWPQIAALYERLDRLLDSPVVRLNRAVAVAMADGAQAGIALLETLAQSEEMQRYHPYFAARGDLLMRVGDARAARDAFETAAALAANGVERRFYESRIATARDAQ